MPKIDLVIRMYNTKNNSAIMAVLTDVTDYLAESSGGADRVSLSAPALNEHSRNQKDISPVTFNVVQQNIDHG